MLKDVAVSLVHRNKHQGYDKETVVHANPAIWKVALFRGQPARPFFCSDWADAENAAILTMSASIAARVECSGFSIIIVSCKKMVWDIECPAVASQPWDLISEQYSRIQVCKFTNNLPNIRAVVDVLSCWTTDFHWISPTYGCRSTLASIPLYQTTNKVNDLSFASTDFQR